MPDQPLVYDDSQIRRILLRVKTIAMVGASTSEMRPSYFAMMYLQGKGYRVLPVNPRDGTIEIIEVGKQRGGPRYNLPQQSQ